MTYLQILQNISLGREIRRNLSAEKPLDILDL